MRRRMGCPIIDRHMTEMESLDVLALRREAICVPAMLIGGRLDAALAERAGNVGVIATLEKPLAAARLVELVLPKLEKTP
jgi:FixJ family two-component response regulator